MSMIPVDPNPPKTFEEFKERYPDLVEYLREEDGPPMFGTCNSTRFPVPDEVHHALGHHKPKLGYFPNQAAYDRCICKCRGDRRKMRPEGLCNFEVNMDIAWPHKSSIYTGTVVAIDRAEGIITVDSLRLTDETP